MAYVLQSMSQDEWDALPPAPESRPITLEELEANEKEDGAFLSDFISNLNANALESEEWHRNNPLDKE